MNAEDHFKAAEALLLSCQMAGSIGETPETYPAVEDGLNTIGNALAAAQVHATLALAASHMPGTVTIETKSVPLGVGDMEKITGITRTERRGSA